MAKNGKASVAAGAAPEILDQATLEPVAAAVDGANAAGGANAIATADLAAVADKPAEALSRRNSAESRLAQVTIGDALMVVVGLLAAVTRLVSLGGHLLTPAEATAALANWQYWQATATPPAFASPAYFSLTNLLMATGSSSDALARTVPALFGLLTVLLPWLWRGRVSPLVYLVAGLFMAVSPVMVAVSRTAGGDAIALFALLLLFITGFRVTSGGRSWSYLAGAAAGLGVTSSPLFYSGLLALVPAAILVARRSEGADAPRLTLARLIPVAATATVTALLLSTSFLLYPAGIGVTLRMIPAWLSQFAFPSGAGELLTPYLAALRYEPALLFLGLPAVIWAFGQDNKPASAAALWWSLSLAVMLIQPGVVANASLLALPGYWLVGLLAAQLFGARDFRLSSGMGWAAFGALLLLGMVLLVAVGRFTRLGLWSGNQATLVGLATLAFVFAGIVVILALAWDNAPARAGMFAGLVVLLLYFQWGTGWRLSREGANDPRERWVTSGTHEEVGALASLLSGVSRQTVNSSSDLAIFSLVDSPALRWYLRDFRRLQVGAALPLDAQPDAVIAPEDVELMLPSDYFGKAFGLEQRQFETGEPLRTGDLLRWWLFRESTAPLDQSRAVVWLRSGLAESP